jgi:iron complex transport system permease protein
VALVAMLVVSACIGALSFTPAEIGGYLAGLLDGRTPAPEDLLGRNVFLTLRLPRVILCGVTGAVLGLSGALMQGLFRNPIVEPGLAGTSAGAALGAAFVFVYGGAAGAFTAPLGTTAVPAAAFVGAFAATMLVYRVSTLFGRTDVLTLLLAGIAVNAVCNAGTGFLSYVARDPQARNITFWNFGTFTTADWPGTLLVLAVFLVCLAYTIVHAKALNALMLGEENAASLGLEPDRLIFRLLIVNTAMVAVATAMVGVISFVGLVVPHVLRLSRSSDYRFLVPGSALLGAVLMEMFDVVARLVIRPAELPIGIITALVGAPVFLWVLVGGRRVRRDALV